MNQSNQNVADLARQGMAALQQGQAESARDLFLQATLLADVTAAVWLGLAFAQARLGQQQATLEAVDHALQLEPRNLRALIFKGDHLAEHQQSRKAMLFYKAALKVAAGFSEMPNDVRRGLERAQQRCQGYVAEYESYLLQELEQTGYQRGKAPARFEQALDIAFGKKEIYQQSPTRFYYPGLPQLEFFPREQFPWLEQIEEQTEAIRTELLQLLADASSFEPYLQSDPDAVNFNDTSNLDNKDWGAFYFYQQGKRVEENAERCPATMTALDSAPLPQIEGSTPHALFSRLAGNTRIPPHHGLINTRLICHLPLIVPPDCGGLRVGSQTQHWQEGEAYVFDDSMEHEAWNDSNAERVVLLFDIWRPELSHDERELIGSLLQSVQRYENE